MRYFTILLFCSLLFTACKKEKYGNTRQQIKATTSSLNGKVKSTKGTEESRYTEFGDFITSLTPVSCIGELHVVRFISDTIYGNNPGYDFMTLVMRHPHLGEELVMADFTNNATISVIPEINGDLIMNPDGQGASFREDVTLKLLWMRMGLKQSFELPAEYTNVLLNQFNSLNSQRAGNVITARLAPFNQAVSELSVFGDVMAFYFGMTNSTYIEESIMLDNNVATRHIRSSNYSSWTMTPPLPGETKTYISTIGFVNDNIIQIYAGADNIPYTSDDIIVLEPEFWEKIYVKVEEN
jgi:hypothetical protein